MPKSSRAVATPSSFSALTALLTARRIFDERALGEFELDHARIDAGRGDGARDAAHQKLPSRNCTPDTLTATCQRGRIAVAPAPHLRAGLAQHPIADLDDQPALLGQRDEFVRRDEAALRMRPAQQRLDGLDPQILEREARLIVQREFAALQRLAQVGLQRQPFGRARADRFLEELHAARARPSCRGASLRRHS